MRASLYLLRINSVDALVDQVFVVFVVEKVVLVIVYRQMRHVQWLHRVSCECTRRRANLIVLVVHDVVIHWVRLLFVRVRLNYFVDHLLFIVNDVAPQVSHVLS